MIIERILQLIDFKKITKYKFCKDLGFSTAFLDKQREISTDKYSKILEYFPDVSPDWLLNGRGEMLKESRNNASNNNVSNGNFQQGEHINDIKTVISAITDIQKDYQKIIDTKDRQIKQLLTIIEKR